MADVGRAATDTYSKNDKANHTLFEGTGYLFEAGKLYNVCQVLPLRPWYAPPQSPSTPVATGNKLRLPDEAICSACVMFHTFFEAESTSEYCLHVSFMSKVNWEIVATESKFIIISCMIEIVYDVCR